ncbi:hypothetical protein H4S07_003341 [Coemansia furcata]|uniref:Uncharacterized protein n=1 Tax=Coemansia furcata TaxID=417177 RepID=A0ACC1LHW4_9FUNG|nr:hypothetical protein H4S07_003341 [Coemansia furcata]
MKLRCIAILNRRDIPVYMQNFDETPNEDTNVKYQYLAHTSVDVIEERMANGKSTDLYLGLLQTVGEIAIYGYVLNTGARIILMISVPEYIVRSAAIREIFQQIHAGYIALVCNPFNDEQEEGKKCIGIDTAYNVGAVIASGDKHHVLSTGYSRELPGNTHAEQCALMKIAARKELVPKTAVMYTTMEPCSKRSAGNTPCVKRVLESGIRLVYVGAREPPIFVQCTGIKELTDNGVKVVHIAELEAECKALNLHLERKL